MYQLHLKQYHSFIDLCCKLTFAKSGLLSNKELNNLELDWFLSYVRVLLHDLIKYKMNVLEHATREQKYLEKLTHIASSQDLQKLFKLLDIINQIYIDCTVKSISLNKNICINDFLIKMFYRK